VHAFVDVHDTPDKALSRLVVGLGVAWTAHLVPSQISAKVTKVPLLPKYPTAVHAVFEVHDTQNRTLPRRLGVGWIAHAVPFQTSANPMSALYPDPTAVHAFFDVHDTADRAPCPPVGLGVASTVQVMPSQTSANVVVIARPGAV
jgi:hypothetical protein